MNEIIEQIKQFKIHPFGWKMVAIFSGATVLLSFIASFLAIIGILMTIWCIYFFRDPKRILPDIKDGTVISPADGMICKIEKAVPDSKWDMGKSEMTKISIFMNIFNVHINRIPISGEVEKIIYHKGKFINASLDKASEDNERNTLVINNKNHGKIAMVQIAGLIARRIICNTKEREKVKTGEQMGIITFGSRVDIYLPKSFKISAKEKQTMIGGETVIANA